MVRSVRWSLSFVLGVMVCFLPAWGQDVPVRTLEWLGGSVAFSYDGRTLASSSVWSIKLWDVATCQELHTLRHRADADGVFNPIFSSTVAFSPDGQTLASSATNTIMLWDMLTEREILTITGCRILSSIRSHAFSPDGRTLASGSTDRTIKLWDVATGRDLRTFTGHTGMLNSVAFSPDGQTLASGSHDRTIRLWDVATGQELRTLRGHTSEVSSVSLSPDGRTLASGSFDYTIKLWDVATGRELRTLTGHTGSVYSVAFSPDGSTLASGSADDTIKLWDVATGRELRTLTGHTRSVLSVAFSPDGRTLASGSFDYTIKLWGVAAVLGVNEPPEAQFAFTPTQPSTLDTVRFTDQSTDPDGEVVSWRWEFGDGNVSTLQNPTHRYTRKGTFTVRLTVTDDDGATDTTTRTITVVNLPPEASFTVALHIEHLGLLLRRREVTFDASDSYDPDGEIVRYAWGFGDGNTAEGRIVTHTYPEAGTYTVRLTVTDDDGMTDTAQQEVQVVPGGGGGPG